MSNYSFGETLSCGYTLSGWGLVSSEIVSYYNGVKGIKGISANVFIDFLYEICSGMAKEPESYGGCYFDGRYWYVGDIEEIASIPTGGIIGTDRTIRNLIGHLQEDGIILVAKNTGKKFCCALDFDVFNERFPGTAKVWRDAERNNPYAFSTRFAADKRR